MQFLLGDPGVFFPNPLVNSLAHRPFLLHGRQILAAFVEFHQNGFDPRLERRPFGLHGVFLLVNHPVPIGRLGQGTDHLFMTGLDLGRFGAFA